MGEQPGRGYLPPTVPAPGTHRRQWPPPPFNFYPGGGGGGVGGGGGWQGTAAPTPVKQFLLAPPHGGSSPQSEGMDLSSPRAPGGDVNGAPGGGGELNGGTGVSVIAPNPLLAEEKPPLLSPPPVPPSSLPPPPAPPSSLPPPLVPPRLPIPPEAARTFDPTKVSELFLPPKVFPGLTTTEEMGGGGAAVEPAEALSPANTARGGRRTPPQAAVPGLPQPSEPAPAPAAPPTSESALVPSHDKSIVDPDHVESLLENMFQGEAKPSVIVSNCSRPAALTEDRVVEILQDRESCLVPEVKLEEVGDPATAPGSRGPPPSPPPVLQPAPGGGGVRDAAVKEEPTENQFMEVESELEKMFAGIEEEKPAPLNADNSIKPKKKLSKPRPRKSTDSLDTKKRKVKKEKPSSKKTKREKDTSNDSCSLNRNVRGPYLRLEGPKESPSYVSIVNSGGREEEERGGVEKRKHIEGRVRGANLYNSTLSSRYNTQSMDLTWICIFCKLRAHCEGGLGGEPAGDLFGPYIYTIPKPDPGGGGGPSEREVSAEQKRKGGGKIPASLRATGALDPFLNNFSKKSSKKPPTGGGGDGGGGEAAETGRSGADGGGEREIWTHEKCAIWAPGVYLAGSHLVGLAEAVSAAAKTKCGLCGANGACIGCIRRGCPGRVHYGCGLSGGWRLDEANFSSICPIHSIKKEKLKTEA